MISNDLKRGIFSGDTLYPKSAQFRLGGVQRILRCSLTREQTHTVLETMLESVAGASIVWMPTVHFGGRCCNISEYISEVGVTIVLGNVRILPFKKTGLGGV